jgi:membrane-bound serine protease (ClpP class)
MRSAGRYAPAMRAALAALLAAMALLLCSALGAAADASAPVDVIPLNAAINPITAGYIEHDLQQAQRDNAAAAIIELDTPGGLDSAMRQIIRAMSSSSVPVVVYVSPPGARAGSAGVFITMAADVAAMAPSTNIGAAHPVGLPGQPSQPSPSGQPTGAAQGTQPSQSAPPQSDSDVEATKVLNDSVAYIRSLAESHGRNADWAEQAVRQSVSVSNQQALDQHIVDLQANSMADLLAKLDGRTIRRPDGTTMTLHTAGASVQRLPMSPFEELLSYIADPTVAYLLMLVGVYGVIFELASPGAILPGVLGGLALILGLLSLGMLPVNYAGLALMLFSFLLFVADIKMPTHGILTAGGILSFLLGSFALFNTGPSGLGIAIPIILGVTAATALFFTSIVRLGVRARKARPTTGVYELIGKVGEARSDLKPKGSVWVNGEWWKAQSAEPVESGAKVEVLDVDGLTLVVRKAA